MTIIRRTLLFLIPLAFPALADTFGTGPSQFTIEFVEIGSPGNAGDPLGKPLYAGAVGYGYRMGTYEVSTSMMSIANSLGGLGLDYTGRSGNKPATDITWNEAARFVNWLNTSTGNAPAYKFTAQPGDPGYSANANISLWQIGEAGYDAANPFRNARARYFLPSSDEWYKAAYYKGGSKAAGYWLYPMQSNDSPGNIVGKGTNQANFWKGVFSVTQSADYPKQTSLSEVGAFTNSASAYGTYDQGGNVLEWNDAVIGEFSRGLRGGDWNGNELGLQSPTRGDGGNGAPTYKDDDIGFRLATLPQPSGGALLRRR